MPKKMHKQLDNEPIIAAEPAVAYRTDASSSDVASSNPNPDWNPNHPVHATQEEWWEHIHKIEQGPFTPWEEAEREFQEWKAEYLKKKGYIVNLAT